MAQCLTDILCGRATAAAMVTLAAAYLAVTLLVQEARFVKRFYVRRQPHQQRRHQFQRLHHHPGGRHRPPVRLTAPR